LQSKVIMPALADHVLITDRMSMIHQNMALSETVSVNAPAGYGKTSLVVSYFSTLPASSNKILWYRLEAEDNNPFNFFTQLSGLLFPPEAAAGNENYPIEQLEKEPSCKKAISFICQKLWDSYNPASGIKVHLVFDDCHNLDYSDKIADSLRFLSDNMPPAYKIYFLGRTPYSITTEKHKLEKKHLEINMDDLTFSRFEIEELMSNMHLADLEDDQISALANKTGGWIAAIIISMQTMKRRKPGGKPAFQELHDKSGLYRYIAVEIYNSVDSLIRESFCKLALLRDFTEESAASIFNLQDLEKLFEGCPELDVFIQRTEGDSTSYRFHPLIHLFLQNTAKSLFPGQQLEEFHFRAAAYYIDRGLFSLAADHIKNCTAIEKTIELVTGVGIRFMLVGESGQLKNWLDLLPQELVIKNPVLLIFKALLLPQTRFGEAEKLLTGAYKYSRKKGDLLLQYRAATALVFIYFCKNNMDGISGITRKIIREMQQPGDPADSKMSILGIMHAIGTSSFKQGIKYAGAQVVPELLEEDYWLYLAYSAVINTCLGKLDEAEKQIEKALTLTSVNRTEPARATALYLLCTITALKNRPDTLYPHLTALNQLSEKHEFIFFTAGAKYLSAYQQYLTLDGESSAANLDEAAFLYRGFGNGAMTIQVKLLKQLWTGQPDEKKSSPEEIARHSEEMSRLKAGLMLDEISLSVRGAITREAGNYTVAENCLLAAINKSKRKGANQVLCGSYFHLAKLYFDTGNTRQACRYLKGAMERAAEGPYYMFWDIHMPTIVEMTIRAIIFDYSAEFAGKLLTRLFDANTAAFLSCKSAGLDSKSVSAFTTNFMAERADNPDKKYYLVNADLFGKTNIQVNGLTIPESAWKTKKNRGLLEYLILCSGQAVSKETIIDLFWPDSDLKSAQTSLRTALYQLRKLLKTFDVEVSGKNSLIIETPESLEIKNSETLESDLIIFKKLYKNLSTINETKKTADPARFSSLDILEKMVSLYRGELLKTRDYGDILLIEREKCKTIFEDACLRLSVFYTEEGRLSQAEAILERLLNEDPYSEYACLELIKLYNKRGKRRKALMLFNDFKSRLKDELNLEVKSSLIKAIQQL